VSGNLRPHFGVFPSWIFEPWNHHGPQSNLKTHSKWDCSLSTQTFASGSFDIGACDVWTFSVWGTGKLSKPGFMLRWKLRWRTESGISPVIGESKAINHGIHGKRQNKSSDEF